MRNSNSPRAPVPSWLPTHRPEHELALLEIEIGKPPGVGLSADADADADAA
jgi:hypothetical protein